jgi:hypothetical protein
VISTTAVEVKVVDILEAAAGARTTCSLTREKEVAR